MRTRSIIPVSPSTIAFSAHPAFRREPRQERVLDERRIVSHVTRGCTAVGRVAITVLARGSASSGHRDALAHGRRCAPALAFSQRRVSDEPGQPDDLVRCGARGGGHLDRRAEVIAAHPPVPSEWLHWVSPSPDSNRFSMILPSGNPETKARARAGGNLAPCPSDETVRCAWSALAPPTCMRPRDPAAWY